MHFNIDLFSAFDPTTSKWGQALTLRSTLAPHPDLHQCAFGHRRLNRVGTKREVWQHGIIVWQIYKSNQSWVQWGAETQTKDIRRQHFYQTLRIWMSTKDPIHLGRTCHAGGTCSGESVGSVCPNSVSRNFALLHLCTYSRVTLNHCNALYAVASCSDSKWKMARRSLRSWAKDTSIHNVCVCVCAYGWACVSLSVQSEKKKRICTLHQFPSFLWFYACTLQCYVGLCMEVCVGNKMYAFLLCEREYYDEQLPLNDRLCPAAVINHAHCPLQPPSSTHQRAQAAAQAGRYKQDPGTTNPPINTYSPLYIMLGRQAPGSKSTKIRGTPMSCQRDWNCVILSCTTYQCVCPSCGSKRRHSTGLCRRPWDPWLRSHWRAARADEPCLPELAAAMPRCTCSTLKTRSNCGPFLLRKNKVGAEEFSSGRNQERSVGLPSLVPLRSVSGPVLGDRLGFCVRWFCLVQSKSSLRSWEKPHILSSSKPHTWSGDELEDVKKMTATWRLNRIATATFSPRFSLLLSLFQK